MKMLKVAAVAATLTLGACTTTSPTMQTRYALDSSGNLTTEQYMVESSNTEYKVLETVAIVGLGLLGLYFAGEIFDVWDDDDPEPAASQNPLIATGGSSTSEWSTDYLIPTWTTVD